MNPDVRVVIVDYGMGNLFSIRNACDYVGLDAYISSDKKEILSARAIILPGVGAFGRAMESLTSLDLVTVLRGIATTSTPIMGICLGMQLLMTESYEFGTHTGLNIIEGEVLSLDDVAQANGDTDAARVKLPHIGWNRIRPREEDVNAEWSKSLLGSVPGNSYMYFNHSYFVKPASADTIVSTTVFGESRFCSTLTRRNIVAFQFHPECSGVLGLEIYRRFAEAVQGTSHCDNLQS